MQPYKGIHLFGGFESESNIYIINGELIVDTGTGRFFSDIKQQIEAVCDPKGIKKIINTHYHYDHTGGSKKFRDWTKAEVCIHPDDHEYLASGKTLAEFFNQPTKSVTVDTNINEGDIFSTKNFKFEVIHTPGHTPGSICLYDKSKKILISGDTLFEDGVGRVDLPGGSRLNLLKSIQKISDVPVIYLLPGHGSHKIGGVGFLLKRMENALKEERFY